jgi:hypothetical protein
MIQARQLATLRLSAASGLVINDDGFCVVADDLPSLHRYSLAGTFLQRVRLDGDDAGEPETHLPKAVKPDLEALLRLPDGALFALGSGSRPNRRRGFLLRDGNIQTIDLTPLYTALETGLPALNIEGAVVHRDALALAHRGAGNQPSALITLDLVAVLADLARARLGAAALRTVQALELGRLGDARLSITDLALHPDGGLWFSAAAEATDDPYEDGTIRGSVIGCFGDGGVVAWRDEVAPVCKIEGLQWLAAGEGGGSRWLAVTDADDPNQFAQLLELHTPR